MGCLAVSQKAGLIAYCETTLDPKIFILNYPSCVVQVVLEGMHGYLTYVLSSFSDYRRGTVRALLPHFLQRW